MRKYLHILLLFLSGLSYAQSDSLKPKKEKYYRKEEILYDNKRYRRYNSYLTLGAGYLASSIRSDMSKIVGVDLQFHIRRQHFQIGANISGVEFLSNNNTQLHFGYGKRFEKNQTNLALFGGLTYYTGVLTLQDTALGVIPYYYQGIGVYAAAQGVVKLTYDIGFGAELFAEYSPYQSVTGIKFILFFSSAYMGPKKNYNPHVRSENRK